MLLTEAKVAFQRIPFNQKIKCNFSVPLWEKYESKSENTAKCYSPKQQQQQKISMKEYLHPLYPIKLV